MALTAAPVLADPPGAWDDGEAFRDWRLDCPARACALHARLLGADGSEVLRLALAGTPAMLAISTPLGLNLPDGVLLAVGDNPPLALPWRSCRPDGCVADTPADDALLAALRRERAASVTLTLEDGTAVRLPVSLLGFSAAWRAREALAR